MADEQVLDVDVIDRFIIDNELAYVCAGIADVNPRDLVGRIVQGLGVPARVTAVDTFAIDKPIGLPFAIRIGPIHG